MPTSLHYLFYCIWYLRLLYTNEMSRARCYYPNCLSRSYEPSKSRNIYTFHLHFWQCVICISNQKYVNYYVNDYIQENKNELRKLGTIYFWRLLKNDLRDKMGCVWIYQQQIYPLGRNLTFSTSFD